MVRKFMLGGVLCTFGASGLFADFTYEQTSKMTGGAMAGMMRLAGAFSKAAREPMVSTIIVKGDRMANISRDRIEVIDLGAETITHIDTQKKTYSVMTFADMARAMQQASDKMAAKRGEIEAKKKEADASADMNFKVSVKPTEKTRQISGLDTKQTIMTMELQATDKKSGQTGALVILSDMWMAPSIPGYDEVHEFHRRMALKLAYTPGVMNLGAALGRADMGKGFSELAKETSKLKGVPVLQVVKMGADAQAMMAAAESGNSGSSAQQPPPPQVDVKDAAGNAAGSAAAGAVANKLGRLGGLAGGLGGFGGMGRKKKTEDQPPPPQQQQAAGAPQGDAAATLMEMTIEVTNFSSGPVDTSKFAVPGGYKKVENEMEKALR
jgi:hypothetical protein